jgi:glycine cleavage system H protein
MKEYDEGKIWYKRKGGIITVGLTEKAFEEIGSVQGVVLPGEGDEFTQDDVVCEIEGDKAAFEVIAPSDGSIVAINDILTEEFELLESDPLDEGWMFKMQVPKDEEAETEEDDDEE